MADIHADPDLGADVVVVGAGPVGLMLAAELRLGGATVTVLEALAEPTGESRASTLHSRTVELLEQRGLFHALEATAAHGVGHFGGIPLPIEGGPNHALAPQWRTERVLAARGAELGVAVYRDHAVTGLRQEADGAVLTVQSPDGERVVRAGWVVGADGRDSTVRSLAGIDFTGTPARRELLRADVTGIDVADRRFQRLHGGLAIAATRGSTTRVMMHEFGAAAVDRASAPDFAEVAATWSRITGDDISGGAATWTDVFDDTSRQADRYRDGRVLLCGDAAHHHMPVGGQSINVGLQDAVNLGWKLASVVSRHAPGALLDTYEAERRPVGARIRALVDAQAQVLLGGHEAEPLRELLGDLVGFDQVAEHLGGLISGRGLGYDLGGPGEHPLLGARTPELEPVNEHSAATLRSARRSARGIVGVVSEKVRPRVHDVATAARWAGRVELVSLVPADGLEDGELVLVRPDDHVAWVGPCGEDLYTALRTWFGVPSLPPAAAA